MYGKDPGKWVASVSFSTKTPDPAFCGYSLREIFACNYLVLRKAVRTSHVSRNKPGV